MRTKPQRAPAKRGQCVLARPARAVARRLLSAALRDRLPEQVVLFVAMRDEWKWIVTPEIMAEYALVLRRPKFRLSQETP